MPNEHGIPAVRKIQQSVVRWTYQQLPLETLCNLVAEIGYARIDVLMPEEFSVPARDGLRCTMDHVGLGDNKAVGINRTDITINLRLHFARMLLLPRSTELQTSSRYTDREPPTSPMTMARRIA